MAIEKIINVVVKEVGLSKVQKDVNKLDASLENLSDTQKELSSSTQGLSNSVLENGGAMGLLNDATGGMAMTVKDAVEASVLFAKGSKVATAATALQTWVTNGANVATKAFRATLISTGIGAVVVLITALVVAMSNMESSAEKAERAQKLLNDEIERSNSILSEELSSIDYVTKAQILRAETQGKSAKEIQAIERDASKDRLKLLKEEEERLLKARDNQNKTPEQAKAINDALIKNTAAFNKEIQSQELTRLGQEKDIANKKRDDESKAIENGKAAREKSKEARIKADEADAKALEEKIKSDAQKAFELNEQAKQDSADITSYKNEKAEEQAEKEEQDGKNKIARIQGESDAEIKIEEEASRQKQVIANANYNIASKTIDLLGQLAGKNKALQKAGIIASAGLGIYSVIKDTQAANMAAIAPPPLGLGPIAGIALQTKNTIQGGLSIAAIAAASGKALAAVGGGGSVQGGGAGGSTQSAPSFNLVQGTGSNQVASSINTQQPIEAFVVSKNVSTGQELDRNIIKSASL